MADNAPVRCRRLGEGGWHFEQGFGVARPARCGSWLFLWDGRNDFRLAVRSLVTGKIVSKKTFSQRPVMACAAQDGLWVGIHGVELLNLPTLTTRWRLAAKTGRIENIAVSETYVAYEEAGADESTDIVLMERPKNQSCRVDKHSASTIAAVAGMMPVVRAQIGNCGVHRDATMGDLPPSPSYFWGRSTVRFPVLFSCSTSD